MTVPRRWPTPGTVATAVALAALVAVVSWSERRPPEQAPVRAPAITRPSGGAAAPGASAPDAEPPAVASAGSERPARDAPSAGPIIGAQQIHDSSGHLIFSGDIDLGPVFARIAAGRRDPHRNDGTVFANREGRLPPAPRGYYTEWVVRTEGVRDVGPQRLITGRKGEAFYTPDHYETFVPVRAPS